MIEVGQTLQLNATVYPENTTNKTVTWISSDPEVASVDQNGLVTVHKKNGMQKVIIQPTQKELIQILESLEDTLKLKSIFRIPMKKLWI